MARRSAPLFRWRGVLLLDREGGSDPTPPPALPSNTGVVPAPPPSARDMLGFKMVHRLKAAYVQHVLHRRSEPCAPPLPTQVYAVVGVHAPFVHVLPIIRFFDAFLNVAHWVSQMTFMFLGAISELRRRSPNSRENFHVNRVVLGYTQKKSSF